MRSFLVLVLVGTLGLLVGCSNNGTPAGIAITISLSPSTASVNAGGVVNVVATVANDPSGKGVTWTLSGVGKLSAQTSTSVTYTAPATVTTTSVATVVATSVASTSVTASLPITVSPAGTVANVVPISVNGGPLAPATIYPNGVTIAGGTGKFEGANGTEQHFGDALHFLFDNPLHERRGANHEHHEHEHHQAERN